MRVQGTQTRQLVKEGFTMPALTNLTIESKITEGIKQMEMYVRTELAHFPTAIMAAVPGTSIEVVRVYVPQMVMLSNSAPALESVYSSWSLTGKKDLGSPRNSYVFTGLSDGPSGWLCFNWMAAKTDEEMNTPFETLPMLDNHTWHPILKDVRCRPDAEFPLATNVGDTVVNTPRNYVSVDYVPEVEEGSRILLRRYYGPRVHNIPHHKVPVPTSPNWDIPGAQDMYRKVLHDDIGVFAGNNGAVIMSGPEAKQMLGISGAEFFPATNFTSWMPYVFKDTQTKDEFGGYLRESYLVIPPVAPKTIKDKL